MKPCTKALYVSLMSRCDSAAIVPNTSELLPEPDTPVNAVSRRFGMSMLTSLRLFTRAPSTRIRSWLSAACAAVLIVVPSPPSDPASLSTSSATSDETRRLRSGPARRGGVPVRGTLRGHPAETGARAGFRARATARAVLQEAVPAAGVGAQHRCRAEPFDRGHG